MTRFDRRIRSHRDSARRALARRRRFAPALDALECRALLSTLVVSNANDSGAGSLRQQIADASGGDTITFSNKVKGQTITLTSGELNVTSSITIQGPGAGKLAVSGGGSSEVFDIGSGVTATISGLTITDGNAANGGGISNAGTLTLESCAVTDSQATGFIGGGGGIDNSGTLTLESTTVAGNLSTYSGGGIYNSGTLTLDQSNVSSNEVNGTLVGVGLGGGIEDADFSTLTISDSTISDNLVTTTTGSFVQGGGIDNEGGSTLTVSKSTISGNQATGGIDIFGDGGWGLGAGVYNGGTATFDGSTLSDNQAIGGGGSGVAGLAEGGAIDDTSESIDGTFIPATLSLVNCTLSGNEAVGGTTDGTGFISEGGCASGGGIYSQGDSPDGTPGSIITLSGCTVTGNQAVGGGGGLGSASGGAIDSAAATLTLSGCTVTGNQAVGGLGGSSSSAFFTSGSNASGGGIYGQDIQFTITNSTFGNNQAIGGAAGAERPLRLGWRRRGRRHRLLRVQLQHGRALDHGLFLRG